MKSLVHHVTHKDGDFDINYILHKSQTHSDMLIVSFPGAQGLPGGSEWGYLVTLQKFNINALFFNTAAELNQSRLTFRNQEPVIENAIIALVKQAQKDTGATRIITIGTSMGGFCAFYYGLKYDWDVISGAPPYSIKLDSQVRFAAGGVGKAEREWLDKQLYSIAENAGKRNYNKKFLVFWGAGEDNWKSPAHGPKLLADLDAAGIKYIYKLYPYSAHTTVRRILPNVLKTYLGWYLGVEDEPQDDETGLALSPEAQFMCELKEAYAPLVAVCKDYENNEPIPNVNIQNCRHYGDLNHWTALRNYVYIDKCWYWGYGYKEPVKIPDKNAFWRSLPLKKVGEGLCFWFQDTLLNYYEQNGDDNIFEWCAENARQYLEYISRVADPKYNASGWHACRRMHFFIAFHKAAALKGFDAEWLNNIPQEILRDVLFFIEQDLFTNYSAEQFCRVLGILHAAMYFKSNAELFNTFYNASLEIALKLIDFYFDANGVLTFMQLRQQSVLAQNLHEIINFISSNNFEDTKLLKALRRKYNRIIKVCEHITRPDGVVQAIGHSIYEAAIWTNTFVERKACNFIKSESNIAFLEDDQSLSYITINGGSNIHSDWRHCDLLSFTWFYDGKQVFRESEGGTKLCAEFAKSSIAHNAFICDDLDYVTPDYFDWTAIDKVDERNDYVIISTSHTLIDGVEMKRKFVWIKPNIMVLIDEGESKSKHNYTQNFILENVRVDKKDKTNVVLTIAPEYTATIKQFGSDNFNITEYYGTTNPKDAKNVRGSLVTNWEKLRKGLCLAYTVNAASAKFVTAIEMNSRSDRVKDVQKSVRNITFNKEDNFIITLTDGTVVNE